MLRGTLSPTRRCTTRRKSRSPPPYHMGQLSNWVQTELAPVPPLPPPHLQTNTVRDPTACSAAPTSVSAPTTPPRSAPDTIRILTSPAAPHPPRQLPSFSPRFFLPQHISTPRMSPTCNPSSDNIFPLLLIHPSSDSPVKAVE